MSFRNPLQSLLASGIIGLVRSDQIVPELLGKIITGALIRTAAAGRRWELDSASFNELRAFTGLASEIQPANIGVYSDIGGGWLTLISPDLGIAPYSQRAQLTLSTVTDATPRTAFTAIADEGTLGPISWDYATGLAGSLMPFTAPNLPIAGLTAFTFTAAAAVLETINFPAGHFANPPVFTGTVQTGVQRLICTLAAPATADSVSVRVATADNTPITGTVNLNWMAMIPT